MQTLPLVNSMRPVLKMAAVGWLTGLPLFNTVSKMFLNLTAAGNIFLNCESISSVFVAGNAAKKMALISNRMFTTPGPTKRAP